MIKPPYSYKVEPIRYYPEAKLTRLGTYHTFACHWRNGKCKNPDTVVRSSAAQDSTETISPAHTIPSSKKNRNSQDAHSAIKPPIFQTPLNSHHVTSAV